MTDAPRRFPPPWRADKIPGGHVVRDANGQALPYLSRENETEALQPKMLTKDEARRIGMNIARLPELFGKGLSKGSATPTSAFGSGCVKIGLQEPGRSCRPIWSRRPWPHARIASSNPSTPAIAIMRLCRRHQDGF